MTINKKLQVILPIAVFLAGMLPVLYNIGSMGLLEPTESLIASVARNMIDTNNFSTPIYNDIKIFDYSPGVYWITSFGIKLFGCTDEFGARFFLSVAAGMTALCIFFIAKLFFGQQCAVISSLLLCTSFLFQISFRIISPAAYSVAFESFLCLIFFYYLNKPSIGLRHFFWLALAFGFLFFGISIFYPIIAVTLVALYTGQKKPIEKLYQFGPGIINFLVFGLSWYFIQIILNKGLLSYYLFEMPYNAFFKDYKGLPFWLFLIIPFIAVFPWTSIWIKDLKSKIYDFKEDPVVTYLVSWALLPFIIRLLMTSREYSHFMSSLPPLLLLTAPAFQAVYLNKDDKSEKTIAIVKERRKHNFILATSVAILGMMILYYGFTNFETARVVSQTMIFTGIFWLFSALIIVAFMIKKLNKSVIVPAAMLVPSLILFTVPAIQGHEPFYEKNYLSSKHVLLKRIKRMPESDFVFCGRPVYGSYFYAGRNFKLFDLDKDFKFITKDCFDKYLIDVSALKKNLEESEKGESKRQLFLVMPASSRNHFSNRLSVKLNLSAEESDFIVVTKGEAIKNGIKDN